MSNLVGGVPLEALYDPINTALKGYAGLAGIHKLAFDLAGAGELKPGDSEIGAPHSKTNVEYLGDTAAQLVVVALAPGSGTGNEDTHQLSALRVGSSYPRDPQIVPRSREEDTDSEIYLPLVSFKTGAADAPRLFAGRLSVLSFQDGGVVKSAEIGQRPRQFRATMAGQMQAEPDTALTVGYGDQFSPYDRYGDYFGGNHALHNPASDTLQVFGLIALDHYASWQLPLIKDLQATPATLPRRAV